jgi:hypothetical protein
MTKLFIVQSDLVQFRDCHELNFGVFVVKEAVNHDRHTREYNIVSLVDIGLVKRLASEYRPYSKPKLSNNVKHVLVESPADQIRVLSVTLSAMDKEKRKQLFELPERIITTSGGLHTLMTSDADSNMSFIDHGNVVSSISNGQSGFVRELFSY